MKVYECDQFTVQQVLREGVTLEQVKSGTFAGGEAARVLQVFGEGKLREAVVADNDWPSPGWCWLTPDLDGRLVILRSNYDSSD